MRQAIFLLCLCLLSSPLHGTGSPCVMTEAASTGTCSPCTNPPGNCSPCGISTHDCDGYNTNPDPHLVTPQSSTRVIQVVWHIILGPSGEGDCSAQVAAQMQLLNDAYGAKPGSPFGNSVNTRIQFVLASKDPNGNPTNGINVVSNHPEWFMTIYNGNAEDRAAGALSWDTSRYLNIFTHGYPDRNWGRYPWDATDTAIDYYVACPMARIQPSRCI